MISTILRKLTCIPLSLFLALFAHSDSFGTSPSETALYVSAKDGKSLAQVRDEIRVKKRDKGNLVVYLDGSFYLDTPLTLSGEDSGVTYTAMNKNRPPMITSGLPLKGWKEKNGIWTAKVPKKVNSFFVNGKRRARAKMPLSGFYTVNGSISKDAQAQFRYNGTDILKKWEGAELLILQKWAESIMPLAEVDESTKSVKLSGNIQPYNREPNARYRVENVQEGLVEAGTWYLDEKSLTLYYHPLADENPLQSSCIIPISDQLIRINGAKDVVFRNITFSYSDWSLPAKGYSNMQGGADIKAVIQADGAERISLENCIFSHLGTFAVWFKNGCHAISILNNEMYDLGAGGIKIGSNGKSVKESQKTSHNTVSGNHVHDIGNVYTGACGIMVLFSSSNTISSNRVHDTYYTGISVGWSWDTTETEVRDNLIENNTVYSIGRNLLSDMGAIYTLGYQPGTVVRKNTIHDVQAYGPVGVGIYLDQGSSSITVENNVIQRTKHEPIFCNGCKDNIIRNNVH